MNRTNPVLKDQVIEQTRDIPGLSSLPGVPIKTVKTWCARRPDAAAHDQFSHGPAKSLDDLGMVPEGHFVIGYTKDDEMICRWHYHRWRPGMELCCRKGTS